MDKLFFIGQTKFESFITDNKLELIEFVNFYNDSLNANQKPFNKASKYMMFDYKLKNKFIEKYPQLKDKFNKLYDDSETLKTKKNNSNKAKKEFEIIFLDHIPENKKELFKSMLNQFK